MKDSDMNSEQPPSDPVKELQEIIDDMENTISKFSIVGPGVSGSIRDGGYTISPGGITSEESGP
jgi:hypothetical protein